MRIYLHREEKLEAEVVETSTGATFSELLEERVDEVVFLREDDHEVFEAHITLEIAAVEDRAHIFAGTKPKLEVTVQFNGRDIEREFAASTRIERVFEWSVKQFELGAADAAEHTLSVAATGQIPAADVMIGSLPHAHAHLVLSLVPKHRYEG